MENARIWLLVMEAYTRVHVMMTRGGPWTDVWVPWEALRIPSSLHSTDGPCSPPGSSLLQKAITSKRAYFMPSSILQSLAPQLPWPIPVWVILRLWIHLQSALNSSSTLDFRIRFFHVQKLPKHPHYIPSQSTWRLDIFSALREVDFFYDSSLLTHARLQVCPSVAALYVPGWHTIRPSPSSTRGRVRKPGKCLPLPYLTEEHGQICFASSSPQFPAVEEPTRSHPLVWAPCTPFSFLLE